MTRLYTCFVLCFFATGATSQECEEIRFSPGASLGEVSGRVIEGSPTCYTFASGAGQTATLVLSGSENACFTIDGVVDCRVNYNFETARRTYTVGVSQLFPKTEAETFSLELSIQ